MYSNGLSGKRLRSTYPLLDQRRTDSYPCISRNVNAANCTCHSWVKSGKIHRISIKAKRIGLSFLHLPKGHGKNRGVVKEFTTNLIAFTKIDIQIQLQRSIYTS